MKEQSFNFIKVSKIEPMKYWSLPTNASSTQQQKFNRALQSEDYLASLKIDGALYYLKVDSNHNVSLTSRTISKKTGTFVDKIDNLPWLKKYAKKLPANTILCGEVFVNGLRESKSNETTKIMGCLPEKAIERQKDTFVGFYIFDVILWDDIDLTGLLNEERLEYLKQIPQDENGQIFIATYTDTNLTELALETLSKGFEGLVLLLKKARWKSGRTSAWSSIKIKQQLMKTMDCFILSYEYSEPTCHSTDLVGWELWETSKGEKIKGLFFGKDGYKPVNKNYFHGYVNAFNIGLYGKNGEVIPFGRVANITDEVKIAIKNGENYINKVVEISAMEIDPVSCRFRHGKIVNYRDDKTAEECLYSNYFK